MVPMKWVILFFLCIFSPKGCVLHKFFSSEVKEQYEIMSAPYGSLYRNGKENLYTLSVPRPEMTRSSDTHPTDWISKEGWLIFGEDRTHIPIKVFNVVETDSTFRVVFVSKEKLAPKGLQQVELQVHQ